MKTSIVTYAAACFLLIAGNASADCAYKSDNFGTGASLCQPSLGGANGMVNMRCSDKGTWEERGNCTTCSYDRTTFHEGTKISIHGRDLTCTTGAWKG